MILTHEAMLKARTSGHIVCEPFDETLVSVNSIDVRLGHEMWEMVETEYRDLYSETGTVWRKMNALTATVIRTRWPDWGKECPDIKPDTKCFVLHSGKFYLGTTLENIGTKNLGDNYCFVPKMMAKSTTGRLGLTTALCAGLGDLGYSSKWALEIRNVDCGAVPICVGTVFGQVVFEQAVQTDQAYDGADRYQHKGEVRFLPKAMKVRHED